MQRIRLILASTPRIAFEGLFEGESTRMQQVGMFLALLELIRHEQVRVEQQSLFGEIWIMPGGHAARSPDLSIARADGGETTSYD